MVPGRIVSARHESHTEEGATGAKESPRERKNPPERDRERKCVCQREREREREKSLPKYLLDWSHTRTTKEEKKGSADMCVCVWAGGGGGRERGRERERKRERASLVERVFGAPVIPAARRSAPGAECLAGSIAWESIAPRNEYRGQNERDVYDNRLRGVDIQNH